MNTNELLGRIKSNILNIAIIGLAIILAFKFAQNNKKAVYILKKDKEREIEKTKTIEEISKLEARFDEIKKKVNNKDLSGLLNRIDDIAKSSSVKIISVRPNNEESFKYYTKLSYELVVSAENYHAMARFVSRLEHSQDVLLIDDIVLSYQPGDEGDMLVGRLALGTILVKD